MACIRAFGNQRLISSRHLLISIEGNIGAGKTTFLDKLKRCTEIPEIFLIEEPVAAWQNLKNTDGKDLLETYYTDIKRWSYTFQSYALLTRFQILEEAIKTRDHDEDLVFITERSLDTDYEVFTKMLYADGSINDIEFGAYLKYFDFFKSMATPTDAIIHIDSPPDVCVERIKSRNRTGEDMIPKTYLETLDTRTRMWLSETNLPVLKIGEDTDPSPVREFIDRVRKLKLNA